MAFFYQKIFVSLLIVLLHSSCSNETLFLKITELNYGSSFGMCAGYCKQEVNLMADRTTFNCSGWVEQYPLKTSVYDRTFAVFDSIGSNLPVSDFFRLPATIGCPDCADGGAEWLKIRLSNGDNHMVKFEYQKEPEVIRTQIKMLRKLMSEYNCNEN